VLRREGPIIVYVTGTSYIEGINGALVLVNPITIVGTASLTGVFYRVIVALVPRVVPLDRGLFINKLR